MKSTKWGRWGLVVPGLSICTFFYISLIPYYYLEPQKLTHELPTFFLPKYLPLLTTSAIVVVSFARITDTIITAYRTVAVSAMVFVFIGGASLFNAQFPLIGCAKWLYYNVTGVLLALALASTLRTWPQIQVVCRSVAIISGFVGAYTLVAFFAGNNFAWSTVHEQYNPYFSPLRANGPFGSSVATATYIACFLPTMLWLFFCAKTRLGKIAASGHCLIAIIAILLTLTRAALAVSVVAVGAMYPAYRSIVLFVFRERTRMFLGAGCVVVAVAGSVIYGVTGKTFDDIQERWRHLLERRAVEVKYGGLEKEYDSLFAYTERFRLAQYQTVYGILKEHPLFGVGFGNFTRVFEQYADTSTYVSSEFPEHTTENMYLMIAAETGLAGLVSFLILQVCILREIRKGYINSREHTQRMLILACIVAVGVILFNMATWDILNDPTLRLSFWIVVGIGLATANLSKVR